MSESIQKPKDVIVVGVGASADGVEALCELFAHVPPDVQAAFLVITNLGSRRESHLIEVLGRWTPLQVIPANQGASIERGHVYVLPANSIPAVVGGCIELQPVAVEQRERNPIDVCFASLAKELGEDAVGVILSGAAVDGTGCKAIKEVGGFTIAQTNFQNGALSRKGSLGGSQYAVVTASAVQDGFTDEALPLRKIGPRLAEYVRRAYSRSERIEPSKEQLQAVNEELNRMNAELAARIEKQRLLVRELNHRVRNMLQVVIGLASQSIHRSQTLEEFKAGFFGRMQALARAFELLSRDGWHDVPIAELLRTQLGPFATEGNRYTLEGEHTVLKTNAALSLGLVLYELATNATKYGALSVPVGHVHVSWWLDTNDLGGKEFIVRWKESGGPAVKVPTRTGFGTELVQRQLKFELDGVAEMDFAESGLVATMKLPPQDTLEAWHDRTARDE